MTTPPNTPVSNVWIPRIVPCPTAPAFCVASVPLIFNSALMVAFITR